MENRKFYEIHRSDAEHILLGRDKFPTLYSNLKLALLLEKHFPEKNRLYVVKENHLPLAEDSLTWATF